MERPTGHRLPHCSDAMNPRRAKTEFSHSQKPTDHAPRLLPCITLLSKSRNDFAGQELELLHYVFVRHAGEVQPADEVVHAKGIGKTPDGHDTVLWVAYDKAVAAKRLKLIDRRLVLPADKRVLPAAAVLVAVIDHQILLGQLKGLLARLGDDDLARQRVGQVSRVFAGGTQTLAVVLLRRQQLFQVGGRAGHPGIAQLGSAPQ